MLFPFWVLKFQLILEQVIKANHTTKIIFEQIHCHIRCMLKAKQWQILKYPIDNDLVSILPIFKIGVLAYLSNENESYFSRINFLADGKQRRKKKKTYAEIGINPITIACFLGF